MTADRGKKERKNSMRKRWEEIEIGMLMKSFRGHGFDLYAFE